MKTLMIILSMGVLVNNQPDKTQLETISRVKVVEQYKILPQELIKEQLSKKVAKSNKKVAKNVKKKTENNKKTKKNVKKKSYKPKKKKKSTYKQTTRVRYNVGEIQSYAHQLVLSYGWTEEDYQALVLLWYRESGWNPNAVNKKSGACGIPQSLPCSKMAVEGTDYRTNYRTQIRWGLKYIANRYGNPSNAWKHSQWKGWY